MKHTAPYDPKWKPRVISARRPRFSMHRGATWDSHITVILPSGKRTKGYIDTTWGHFVYFQYNGKWKKINNAALIGRHDETLALRGYWRPNK